VNSWTSNDKVICQDGNNHERILKFWNKN